MSPPAFPDSEPRVGDQLGPFRLEALLGEGATGSVFKAQLEPERTEVAVKVLRKTVARDASHERRFLHEARAASAVRHRHIVRLLQAGELEGHRYLAMEYVRGRSLKQRLEAEGPLGLEELVRLVAEVASGLDALHEHGLVHRDVKPSNILLDEQGTALLTDLGLVKGQAYTVLTKPGQVVGTLDYLAPELFEGAPADSASDIYSLGCIVFECLTGSPPFAGKSIFQVGRAHLEEAPGDPGAGREDVPGALSWAVLQALNKQPSRRPQTATAYATMLRVAARRVRNEP